MCTQRAGEVLECRHHYAPLFGVSALDQKPCCSLVHAFLSPLRFFRQFFFLPTLNLFLPSKLRGGPVIVNKHFCFGFFYIHSRYALNFETKLKVRPTSSVHALRQKKNMCGSGNMPKKNREGR